MASEVRDLISRVRPFHHQWKVDVADAGAFADFLNELESEVPYAIFAEVADFRDVAVVIDPVLAACLRAPVVIYGRGMDNQAYLELHRTGVRFFLHLPANAAELESLFQGLRAVPPAAPPQGAPSGKIASFIPAKPGAGASTAAAHFAHACADLLKKRVALVDLDLNCGVQSILPQVESKQSLTEIVRRVHRTGELPAENLITKAGQVDIFANEKRSRTARLDTSDLEDFLSCLERAYPLVVVDHSGNWERYSVLALRRSAAVYYVCGADRLSLSLGDSGRQLFSEDSLPNGQLVLNRAHCRGAVNPKEAASTLQMPLFASLPNAYSVLQTALRTGDLAPRTSAFGAAISEFSLQALEALLLLPADPKRAKRTANSGVLGALGLSAPAWGRR